jgi:hypothetical protein
MLGVRGEVDAAPVTVAGRRRAFEAALPRRADLVGCAFVTAAAAVVGVVFGIDAGFAAQEKAGRAGAVSIDAPGPVRAALPATAAIARIARQIDAAPVAVAEAIGTLAPPVEARHAALACPVAAATMQRVGGDIDAAQTAVHVRIGAGRHARSGLTERRLSTARVTAGPAVVRIALK